MTNFAKSDLTSFHWNLEALPKFNKVYFMMTHEESRALLTSNPQAQSALVFYSAKTSTSKAPTAIQSTPSSHVEKSSNPPTQPTGSKKKPMYYKSETNKGK